MLGGIDFGRPEYGWLLLLLPGMWYFSFRSLAGLGKTRRLLALTLRTLVFTAIVAALAEVEWRKTSESVTVIYVLDHSDSIPAVKREAMLAYVARDVAAHRSDPRRDQAGMIVFGREARIEIHPKDDNIPRLNRIESELQRRDATNLEKALKEAQLWFPEDTAKRIVVLTDGNENLGNARSLAPVLAEAGIGIDVVAVPLDPRSDVSVEKVTVPQRVRGGQTVEARVVLNQTPPPDQPQATVAGKLRVVRRSGGQSELLSEEPVVLPPGKTVLRLRHKAEKPAMYTYEATFTADDPQQDATSRNNQASAYSHVRGKGRVLLIVDSELPGELDFFADRMRAQNLEIVVQPSNQLFSSLAELQAFDCVILANVARSSGEVLPDGSTDSVSSFSDAQIEMLVRNTQQAGCGLIMLGGPNSFGAGGWANTELEKAMPVDFQIRNTKVRAVGALVLMMHASEMSNGNYWQKVIGREAIAALGPMDYAGLVHWSNFGQDTWLWGLPDGLVRVGERRSKMLSALNRMTPGDMPQFDPAMRMALAGFKRVKASTKHMIVISDGDPAPPTANTVSQYVQEGIKISTVAVGTHGPAGSTPLQKLAADTGGKYYVVTNPKALPKIYQREARKVSRPLIFETPDILPQVVYQHEMHQGSFQPPPIDGYILTTVKSNPLVEVSIVADKPDAGGPNSTILASWTYGLGRVVAFTPDVGQRWANRWTQWADYDNFFKQMIQWAMRPTDDEDKLDLVTDLEDGRVRLVITALDKNDEFVNFLEMGGAVIAPDLSQVDVRIRQIAPGRYVGEFPADQAGTYFVTVSPGPGKAPLMAGVDVPYSAEYRDREMNRALLEALAGRAPRGGEPGQVLDGQLLVTDVSQLTDQSDAFRPTLPKAVSRQPVWGYVLVACAWLFLADVFVRRVTLSFTWLRNGWARFRRQPLPETDQRMERLRSSKQQAASQLDQRRAAARFEPQADSSLDEEAVRAALQDPSRQDPSRDTSGSARRPQAAAAGEDSQPEEDYTARLMKAKQRAWRDKPE